MNDDVNVRIESDSSYNQSIKKIEKEKLFTKEKC